MTKNKGLKELKLRAENTYRMNQGLRDSGAVLMAMLTMVFDNGAISGRKEQADLLRSRIIWKMFSAPGWPETSPWTSLVQNRSAADGVWQYGPDVAAVLQMQSAGTPPSVVR